MNVFLTGVAKNIPGHRMPSKAYQRAVFTVLYAIFILIVVAAIAWAIAVEKANDREARAEAAIKQIRNLTPPLVTAKPNPITLQKAKEAAADDVNRKLTILDKQLRSEIRDATETAHEAHAKAGVALDKANVNAKRIRNLTGD